MSLFKMSPQELNLIGQQIIDESIAFGRNVNTIYDTIDGMISKNYLSSEAIAIAKEIESYKQSLINFTKTIENYGTYCQNSAKHVTGIRNDIMNSIR